MNPLDRLADIPPWDWPEEASDLVADALRSPDASVRLEAAQSAWHAMSDLVAERLLRALRDPDPEVAAAAAIALGPTLEEHDIDEFAADPTYGYAKTSRAMFAEITVELQVAWYDASLPDLVRRRVLESAVRAPAEWVEDAVRDVLCSPDADWRTTAVFCCGFLAGFEADILEALDDADLAVRFEAVRACGRRGISDAAPVLLDLAARPDTDRDLRLAAIEALGTAPSDEVDDLLEDLAVDDDEEIAEAAEEALDERSLARSLETWDADPDGELDDLDWN